MLLLLGESSLVASKVRLSENRSGQQSGSGGNERTKEEEPSLAAKILHTHTTKDSAATVRLHLLVWPTALIVALSSVVVALNTNTMNSKNSPITELKFVSIFATSCCARIERLKNRCHSRQPNRTKPRVASLIPHTHTPAACSCRCSSSASSLVSPARCRGRASEEYIWMR